MKTPRMALAALVACAALTACGGQDGGDGTPTPTPTGAQPVTSPPNPDPTASAGDPPSAGPTSSRPTAPPPKTGGPTKPPPVGAVELTGTVAAGVEPNCLLLDGYLLLGGPRDVLTPGARVTVSGRVKPDVMTTCQQGTPFMVESARRS